MVSAFAEHRNQGATAATTKASNTRNAGCHPRRSQNRPLASTAADLTEKHMQLQCKHVSERKQVLSKKAGAFRVLLPEQQVLPFDEQTTEFQRRTKTRESRKRSDSNE
jgi:hypothetical protein